MVKIENTIRNKARFFALYWEQDLWFKKDWADFNSDNSIKIGGDFLDTLDENDCIFLKPLSDLTYEDSKHLGTTTLNILKNDIDVSPRYMFYSDEADYLRSKGYAVTWMGLDIETMIEYGWIKLKK